MRTLLCLAAAAALVLPLAPATASISVSDGPTAPSEKPGATADMVLRHGSIDTARGRQAEAARSAPTSASR